jgi:hypothetical protein
MCTGGYRTGQENEREFQMMKLGFAFTTTKLMKRRVTRISDEIVPLEVSSAERPT